MGEHDKKAATPRVIFIRHGETEWSRSGQYTSRTDLPLTSRGETQMRATGAALIGQDRLIQPENIGHVFVSPRQRARRTLELLFDDCKSDLDGLNIEETCDIREWEYGDYEGMLTQQIVDLRHSRGLDKGGKWSIWRDGCENGELPAQIVERLDRLIEKIHCIQGKAIAENRNSDVLVIAHGHILRCLTLRWVKRDIVANPSFILEAGGVGVLSYEHHNVAEPAICLGGAFKVPQGN